MTGLLLTIPLLLSSLFGETETATSTFELKDGDRVVFLGNTLIEREQKYGYWEAMLTARWPKRNITFRNLGWSGDTVWAESRGIFDSPAKGYQRMIEHVGRLKPMVIFLGYGNNEAFADEKGLPAFIKQYNKLMDDLTKVSAKGVRFVMLSPTAHEEVKAVSTNREPYNRLVRIYGDAIASLANSRHSLFIDFSKIHEATLENDRKWLLEAGSSEKEIQSDARARALTENGVHMIQWGYFETAFILLNQLDRSHELRWLTMTAQGRVKEASLTRVTQIQKVKDGLHFSVQNERLSIFEELLKVKSLPNGKYSLKVDGKVVVTALEKEWNQVVGFKSPSSERHEKLRQAIIEKNLLYFYHWRPQNITYLTGFRKHEQGNNAKETVEFEKLVKQKEAEIAKLRKPVTHTYELLRVKEGDK